MYECMNDAQEVEPVHVSGIAEHPLLPPLHVLFRNTTSCSSCERILIQHPAPVADLVAGRDGELAHVETYFGADAVEMAPLQKGGAAADEIVCYHPEDIALGLYRHA